MTTIAERLQAVRARIGAAELEYGRTSGDVLLLAVSKAQTPKKIREAFMAGQRLFGENYLQEALDKQSLLSDLAIEWHFIGPMQSNKTQPIAQHFSWVHSVDRIKIAERLNAARAADLPPLQVCIQVNVSGEASKSGVVPEEILPLAKAIHALPKLQLRGLMAIPAPTEDTGRQRQQFRLVREAFIELKKIMGTNAPKLDTLSIGMSEDFPAAIAEGATIVRVGSAIFGHRPTKSKQEEV